MITIMEYITKKSIIIEEWEWVYWARGIKTRPYMLPPKSVNLSLTFLGNKTSLEIAVE